MKSIYIFCKFSNKGMRSTKTYLLDKGILVIAEILIKDVIDLSSSVIQGYHESSSCMNKHLDTLNTCWKVQCMRSTQF